MVSCMFLGIYSFLLGYPVSWYIILHIHLWWSLTVLLYWLWCLLFRFWFYLFESAKAHSHNVLTMLWVCKAAGQGWSVCGWGVWHGAWCLRAASGHLRQVVPRALWMGCSKEICDMCSRICFPFMPSESLICLSLHHSLLPPVLPLRIQFSVGVRGKWASLVASCIAGEARCSLTCSLPMHHPSPPPMGGVTAEKGSPGPRLCCLRKGCVGKVRLFHLPSPMCPDMDFFFFPFRAVLELLCWKLGLPWALCHLWMAWGHHCLRQCSPGAPSPWLRVVGAGSWATSGPRSASLLPHAQNGRQAKTFPGSLGMRCGTPRLPQKHFCLWVNATLSLREAVWAGDVLFGHLADVTPSMTHFGELWNLGAVPSCLVLGSLVIRARD